MSQLKICVAIQSNTKKYGIKDYKREAIYNETESDYSVFGKAWLYGRDGKGLGSFCREIRKVCARR